MKNTKQSIKKAVENVGSQLKDTKGADFEAMSRNLFKRDFLMKDALGMSDNMVEGIYGQAYRLYNNGKYKDAAHLFRLLVMLNSTESKYLMGLAACFHMMKEYKSATETYALCSMLDGNNPLPHFHASDCYLQMKDSGSAIISLTMAIKRAEGKPEFQILKDRAMLTLEALKKDLSEKFKNPGSTE
jgi:type III secretion system low calcium response chaperone LcrH/SycD